MYFFLIFLITFSFNASTYVLLNIFNNFILIIELFYWTFANFTHFFFNKEAK